MAWRRLSCPPEDARAWLLAVARRVLANELRRRARVDHLNDRIARDAAVRGVATVQPDHAEALAAGDRIAVAMAELSDRDQEVLQLIAWEGLDQAGAAAVLGCSLTAAKVRLHRARRRLRALLRDTDRHADPHVDPSSEPNVGHVTARTGTGLPRPCAAVTTSTASRATAGTHAAPEDLR